MIEIYLVIPDDPRKGMIFLGEESASYKLGNVRLNIKSAIIAALELVASVNLPESFFNYLQLLIVTAFVYSKATKQEIKQEDAYVLYFYTNGTVTNREFVNQSSTGISAFGARGLWINIRII
mgnify:CR=1 FL=1